MILLITSCQDDDYQIKIKLIKCESEMNAIDFLGQEIYGIKPPFIHTFIWYKGNIVKSWHYEEIKDDSTMIKRRIIAEEWIRRIKANTPCP